jgi:hypothetical protein
MKETETGPLDKGNRDSFFRLSAIFPVNLSVEIFAVHWVAVEKIPKVVKLRRKG